jgi:hypothetical protein
MLAAETFGLFLVGVFQMALEAANLVLGPFQSINVLRAYEPDAATKEPADSRQGKECESGLIRGWDEVTRSPAKAT